MFSIPLFVGVFAFIACSVAAGVLRPRDCSFTWAAIQGDTCHSLADAWSITEIDFISFNPGVDCSNLVAGKEYCVEWQGTKPSIPALPSSTINPKPSTTSSIPGTTTKPGHTALPSPVQEGLVEGCEKFHLAVSGDTCGKIVSTYGTFSLTQFYTWNPAVGNDCSGLWAGYYYCVAIKGTPTAAPTASPTPAPPSGPTPVQDGIATDCQRYHLVVSGDTCAKIVDQYKTFSLAQFYSWNPAVGTSCSALWASYYVCIGVKGTPTKPPTTPTPTKTPTGPTPPSPTQSGISPNCNKWHLVFDGDYCQAIADKYKITLPNFYRWNPAVGNSCASLWLGYYVCVGSK